MLKRCHRTIYLFSGHLCYLLTLYCVEVRNEYFIFIQARKVPCNRPFLGQFWAQCGNFHHCFFLYCLEVLTIVFWLYCLQVSTIVLLLYCLEVITIVFLLYYLEVSTIFLLYCLEVRKNTSSLFRLTGRQPP